MAHKVYVYPHNDLSGLANFHLSVVNEKAERGATEGIALDCMSCIIALAFSAEALINFVGFKKVNNWKERAPFNQKIEALREEIGLPYNRLTEPYQTIEKVKKLRNDMAHAKPIEKDPHVSSFEELRNEMKAPWDEFLTVEFVNHGYKQMMHFETMLLELSDISIYDSVTRGTGSWSET